DHNGLPGFEVLDEVYRLLALVGDRHGRDNDIELARVEGRDNVIELEGDDLGSEAHATGYLLGYIYVQTHGLAGRVYVLLGRVSSVAPYGQGTGGHQLARSRDS